MTNITNEEFDSEFQPDSQNERLLGKAVHLFLANNLPSNKGLVLIDDKTGECFCCYLSDHPSSPGLRRLEIQKTEVVDSSFDMTLCDLVVENKDTRPPHIINKALH